MIKYLSILSLVALLFFSCGENKQSTTPEVSSVAKIIKDTLLKQDSLIVSDTTNNWKIGKYFCPMQCEGDKMYDKEGTCPECGMALRVWRATATN